MVAWGFLKARGDRGAHTPLLFFSLTLRKLWFAAICTVLGDKGSCYNNFIYFDGGSTIPLVSANSDC